VKAIIGKYLFPLANAFKYSVKVKALSFLYSKKGTIRGSLENES